MLPHSHAVGAAAAAAAATAAFYCSRELCRWAPPFVCSVVWTKNSDAGMFVFAAVNFVAMQSVVGCYAFFEGDRVEGDRHTPVDDVSHCLCCLVLGSGCGRGFSAGVTQ